MGRFQIKSTSIDGLTLLVRQLLGDERGYLERVYCSADLRDVLGDRRIEQINHSRTQGRGTVRGLHFQYPPHAETKLVSCLRGEVFDVAVDLRKGSRAFLRWHSEVLSETNHKTLVIPEGFAHGFQTLSDDCEMLYLHTAAHAPQAESGIAPGDPMVGVAWPLPIARLSPRDAARAPLASGFEGI
jgi:dTDP-4-dehydrorhamnose 3,5-epimerase